MRAKTAMRCPNARGAGRIKHPATGRWRSVTGCFADSRALFARPWRARTGLPALPWPPRTPDGADRPGRPQREVNRASATTQADACRRFISHRRSESGITPKGIAPLTEKGCDAQHIACSKLAYRPAARKLERSINGFRKEGRSAMPLQDGNVQPHGASKPAPTLLHRHGPSPAEPIGDQR